MCDGLNYHGKVLINQLSKVVIAEEVPKSVDGLVLHLSIVVLYEFTLDVYQLNELRLLVVLD